MSKENTLVKAINKNVRTSPRKLALVCNFIKGKKADVALKDLLFTRKRIALDVSKTVKSAIANAENNYQFDIDNLFDLAYGNSVANFRWNHLFIFSNSAAFFSTSETTLSIISTVKTFSL